MLRKAQQAEGMSIRIIEYSSAIVEDIFYILKNIFNCIQMKNIFVYNF